MPNLPRNASRLLKTVNNMPHATVEDHEDAESGSPVQGPITAEGHDVHPTRDPESSDDEAPDLSALDYHPRPGKRKARPPLKKARQNIRAAGRGPDLSPPSTSSRNVKPKIKDAAPAGLQLPTISAKDFLTSEEKTLVSSGPDGWTSQGSQKRKRVVDGYGSRAANSSSQKKRASAVQPAIEKPAFRLPQPLKVADRPQLRLPSNSQNSIGTEDLDEEVLASSPPVSPSLESASARGQSRVVGLKGCPSPAEMTITCELCGESVQRSFRDEFELEQCRGKRMNIKMQERFCQAHTALEAKQTWHDRLYPEVDWSRLRGRLERHRQHLEAIIDRRTHSKHRDELQRRVKDGDSRNVWQALRSMTGAGVTVGYYGSRGARVMTEYIMGTLSDKLRRAAGSDSVIGAKGVAGGVSGFVQSVLVAELALMLVMEDLGVDKDEAARVLKESAGLGQVLHQEQDERLSSDEGEL